MREDVKNNTKKLTISDLDWSGHIEDILNKWERLFSVIFKTSKYVIKRNPKLGEKSLDIYLKGEDNRVGSIWPKYRDEVADILLQAWVVDEIQPKMSIGEWSGGDRNNRPTKTRSLNKVNAIKIVEIVNALAESEDGVIDDFWPSYEEYPVNITEEQWSRFLTDVEFPNHKGCMRVLRCFLEMGGTASSRSLSKRYFGHPTTYTSSIYNTCRRAIEYFALEPCLDGEQRRYFPIGFQGKSRKDKESVTYVYRMRPELMAALEKLNWDGIGEFRNYGEDNVMNPEFDKNIILYGPPGTGKTYSSAIYSVAICDGLSIDRVKEWDYEFIMARFDELKNEGRIVFTTFHQSYGYEEFIEGIKPTLTKDNNISYSVEDGVFKAFCKKAIIVQEDSPAFAENEPKNCVFIIDEINRGNISKVFGELITLIEDTKRKGAPEQASAKLPYSGEMFSVPKNVYLLGTMNTADRSIAIMDTALRRRFRFVEMLPDTDVLRAIGADKVQDLDVAAMLDCINERITYLYDREHTIGHAFFTSLAQNPTIATLQAIFEKSVIPLLQEYFYDDYQKIQCVLGDNGKTDSAIQFIVDESIPVQQIFNGNMDDLDLPEKRYRINKEAFSNIESYKKIM